MPKNDVKHSIVTLGNFVTQPLRTINMETTRTAAQEEMDNIIRINDYNDSEEEFDFDFDYDPNEMYYALANEKN